MSIRRSVLQISSFEDKSNFSYELCASRSNTLGPLVRTHAPTRSVIVRRALVSDSRVESAGLLLVAIYAFPGKSALRPYSHVIRNIVGIRRPVSRKRIEISR